MLSPPPYGGGKPQWEGAGYKDVSIYPLFEVVVIKVRESRLFIQVQCCRRNAIMILVLSSITNL